MNKIILMGRLTRDPETRYAQGGAEPLNITKYTLAVDRRIKRENEPTADFITCVAFGKSGEFAERFFKKGMQILITGRLQIRTYDDQQGQKHWVTEVIIEDQHFTESKASFEARSQNASSGQSYAAPAGEHSQPPQKAKSDVPSDFFIDQELNDDDLPF